ncbi:MAG: hypothetical protein NTV51_03205 [Verrucomicrobia bacterium]|nr:hypothetical protein [Verrucomicrobiota bacterium]
MTQPSPAGPIRTRLAFAFSSGLTPAEMLARLRAGTPWSWSVGDSHWYGDYLAAKAAPHDAVLRIYSGGSADRPHALNIRYHSERPPEAASADLAALQARVLEEIMPLLDARDVTPAEPHD